MADFVEFPWCGVHGAHLLCLKPTVDDHTWSSLCLKHSHIVMIYVKGNENVFVVEGSGIMGLNLHRGMAEASRG